MYEVKIGPQLPFTGELGAQLKIFPSAATCYVLYIFHHQVYGVPA